jgi:hypothetical protein
MDNQQQQLPLAGVLACLVDGCRVVFPVVAIARSRADSSSWTGGAAPFTFTSRTDACAKSGVQWDSVGFSDSSLLPE